MRLSLGCLLFLISPTVRAAESDPTAPQETAALRWLRTDSAGSCPSEAEVTLAIEQRLRPGALVPKERASLLVEVELEGLPTGGFRVEIEMWRGHEVVGRRELESPDASCQGVAETAALVIALAIDPEASLEALPIAPAAPTAVETPPPPPEPVSPRVPAVAPAPRPEHRPATWQGELELGVGVATGIVPNVAAGLHARGRTFSSALPVGFELSGVYYPSKRLEALPGKGADFTLFHIEAGLCSRSKRASRIAAAVCAGAQIGRIVGQGYGFSDTPRFRTWTSAAAVRAAVAFRVRPPFAVVIGPWLAIPLKRDHFESTTAAGTAELFRQERFGVGFDLGTVWEL